MNSYELETRYDSRKSFYGKAIVMEENGIKNLFSYGTLVARIVNGIPQVLGTYSATTLRHIKEFLYQNNFEVGSKKEIENLYMYEGHVTRCVESNIQNTEIGKCYLAMPVMGGDWIEIENDNGSRVQIKKEDFEKNFKRVA